MYFTRLPAWYTTVANTRLDSPNLLLGVAFVTLLWLCVTRAWNSAHSEHGLSVHVASTAEAGTGVAR